MVRPLDPRLLRHARAARTLIVGSALVGTLGAAATVTIAVTLAELITAVAVDRAAPVGWALPVLIGAVLVKAAATWGTEALPRRIAVVMVNQLRRRLLDRVVGQDRGWLTRQHPAELIQLATAGVGGLRDYAARYLPQLVLCALVPAGIVVFLGSTDLLSAGIVAGTLPLIPLFMALVGLHTRDHAARQWTALQVLGGHFLDLVAGLPTLKVFSRSRSQEAGVRDAGDRYRTTTLTTLRVAFLSSLVLELLATISVALVAVTIGLRLLHGSLDLRTGLVVLLVAPEAYAALRAVGTHFHASTDGLAAADRLFRVLEAPLPPRGFRPVPAGDIVVSARLHGIALDLVAPTGVVTVLTGPSGSGKSSALSLIAGTVQPEAGTVLAGGVPLAEVDPDGWRSTVAQLVQAPHLRAGTVRANVTALRPDAPVAAVHEALWCAVADEVVAGLPDGLDTVLSEGAPELSQGQRMRIALARTLLADRAVLMLDEPSAALDADTEAELVRRLPTALTGRTVMLASHREALWALGSRVDIGGMVAA
ncbi:thiol reductant ABC exporter subunit CydD [Nakamurella deserti]|uniref:thiol reductant ABC exporter subunit CydD n=1 Tax=Nakamurella deserti TaxID=2164074 RepID=UPI000DBE19F9|nr:thiol reductant ABC exporter subunit CydD [Nakamurella deserti]